MDSIGTGEFEAALAARGLTDLVEYRCFPENVGAAGNLEERLKSAASGDVEFMYAVNHDGDLDPGAIERLVALADRSHPHPGAIYPLRKMTDRGGAFDVTGRYRFPFTAIRSMKAPEKELTEVYWSSCNGALYSLEPTRNGVLPCVGLWLGYEDLDYGWTLHAAGYRQFVARDVQVNDSYEYDRSRVGYVARRPSWYAYYFARNLILASRRNHQPKLVQGLALSRVLLEFGVTLALRKDKKARLQFTAAGLWDGLRGKTGKWRLP